MRSLPDTNSQPPRVRADIDFDHTGKHYGHIRVPRPHTHSGLGVIGIPVVVIKNGTGPTFLLTAGTHGDEYEGQVALMNLARELDAASIQGRLVIVPSLDLPAVKVGHRLCPFDGKDLNRVFPGQRNGSFTEMLADYVTRVLLPITDYNMDIHTGGTYHDTGFNTCSHFVDDPKQMRANIDLGLAWGAPYHAVLRESDHTNSFMTIADQLGVPALSSEFGGLARIGNAALAMVERGLRNILKLHRVIEGVIEKPDAPTRLMGVPDPAKAIVYAPHGGLFHAFHNGGDWIEEGEEAGRIYDFEDPARPPTVMRYPRSGCLWAVHTGARIEAFDALCIVMNEIDRSTVGL
ncbi:MAG: succinylglutamate desuccinylase/aspartoacylase family protein [Proteobacteria bacterium]|nr:succinylglutamate desuccinylase/aspartoacylase family protein [Pseudomonadota bacterium]MBI3499923.1 succinylglutamate desuccinylase/aspartoacylase family protein [Pseudomonadota bacterium]